MSTEFDHEAARRHLRAQRESLGIWLVGVVGTRMPAQVELLRQLLEEADLVVALQRRLESAGPNATGFEDGEHGEH